MNSELRSVTLCIATLLCLGAPVHASAQALSEFAGSELKGTYKSEYDRLAYLDSLDKTAPVKSVEGRMVSRLFEKPDGKSNLEVFRSYQNELTAGGFTIHLATALDAPSAWRVKQLYDPPNTSGLNEREYVKAGGQGRVGLLDLAFVVGSAGHYLIASRSAQGEERWVAVVLSGSRPSYMIEELTLDVMETGTVTLDLEAMRSEIETSGKIAIYDIRFATGSAVIEPESADALSVIATYLNETAGGFYIVGHTDDTGSLQANMQLSDARAAAVKLALIEQHGIDAGRLETRGVGPLAPVSTNTGDAGRTLNRRVEIVQRLN